MEADHSPDETGPRCPACMATFPSGDARASCLECGLDRVCFSGSPRDDSISRLPDPNRPDPDRPDPNRPGQDSLPHNPLGSGSLDPGSAAPRSRALADPVFRARFQIIGDTGARGTRTLIRGLDRSTDRPVAIWFPAVWRGCDFSHNQKEWQTLAGIQSERLINIHHWDLVSGEPYVVMESPEGTSLRQEILKNGPLSASEARRTILQILEGLQDLHDAGILHRDLTSSSILLTADRNARISLIRPMRGPADGSLRARLEAVLGSPHAMAPEQARGLRVGSGADIYSIGVILFEVITGRLPFTGPNPIEILAAPLGKRPPPVTRFLGHLPTGLEPLVERALAREPSERFGSPWEMAASLESLDLDPIDLDAPAPQPVGPDPLDPAHGDGESARMRSPTPASGTSLSHGLVHQPGPATNRTPGASRVMGALAAGAFIALLLILSARTRHRPAPEEASGTMTYDVKNITMEPISGSTMRTRVTPEPPAGHPLTYRLTCAGSTLDQGPVPGTGEWLVRHVAPGKDHILELLDQAQLVQGSSRSFRAPRPLELYPHHDAFIAPGNDYLWISFHSIESMRARVRVFDGVGTLALQELNMDAPARWFGWMVRGLLPLTSYTVTIDSLDEDVFFITDRHRKIETRTRDDGFRREIDQKIQNLDNPFLQFQGVDLQILRPAHARAAMLDQLSRSFASDLGFATLTKAVSLIAEPSHESRLIELLDNQREPDRRLVLAEAISRQYNPVHFARVWKVLQEIDQTERELETSPDHVVRTHGSQVGTLLNLDRNEAVKVARTVASRCRQHSVWLQRIMASVLASCRHEGAADLLAQMAGCSSDAMTRDIALLALAALDRTAPVLRTLLSPGLDLAPATESLVSIALGAVGSVEDVELLKPRLHLDGHPLVRQGAIIGLGMIGQPAIAPPLLEALRDADAASRCRITWGLGRSGDPSVMPLLGRAVDKGEGALGELAWAIHTLGGNAAIPLLEKLSRWEPTTPERTMERAHAVLALVECGKGPDTDALIEATRDSNRYVAGCALIALGSRGGRRAEDHLRAIALRHADSRLRITAMKELVTMGVPCLKLLQDLKTNKTESRQITNVVAQLLPLVESAMPRTVQVRLPGFLPFLRTKDRLVTGDVRHVLARGFLSPGLDLANAVEIDSGSRPGSNFNPYLSFRAGFNRPDFLRLERPTVNRSGTGDVLIHLESSENQQILGFLTVSLFDPAR